MHSAWVRSTFCRVLNFLQMKDWGPNFRGEPILLKVWFIWSPHLYLNFKSFVDQNSASFNRFQWILRDLRVIFAPCWNFYKLKRWGVISGGNQCCRKSDLFGSPFCFSILKILCPQFHSHSIDSNASCMIQEYFSQSIEISTN